jgi:hypothetical protein
MNQDQVRAVLASYTTFIMETWAKAVVLGGERDLVVLFDTGELAAVAMRRTDFLATEPEDIVPADIRKRVGVAPGPDSFWVVFPAGEQCGCARFVVPPMAVEELVDALSALRRRDEGERPRPDPKDLN